MSFLWGSNGHYRKLTFDRSKELKLKIRSPQPDHALPNNSKTKVDTNGQYRVRGFLV